MEWELVDLISEELVFLSILNDILDEDEKGEIGTNILNEDSGQEMKELPKEDPVI